MTICYAFVSRSGSKQTRMLRNPFLLLYRDGEWLQQRFPSWFKERANCYDVAFVVSQKKTDGYEIVSRGGSRE